jgi:hypothetical protein
MNMRMILSLACLLLVGCERARPPTPAAPVAPTDREVADAVRRGQPPESADPDLVKAVRCMA